MGFKSLARSFIPKSWLGDDAMWSPLGEGGARGAIGFKAQKTLSKNLTPMQAYCLSVAANAGVRAYTKNISRAKLRFFTRSGEEIVGGEVVDAFQMPYPGVTTRRWVEWMVSWLLISGEMAAGIRKVDGKVTQIVPLAPYLLHVQRPTKFNTRADVVQWRYNWPDGTLEYWRDDYLFFDRMFNPEASSIRGLSPLFTSGTASTAGYHAEVYIKSALENCGVPSHMLVLPDGVPEATRKDIERRYIAEFSGASNAHKVMVVSGTDVKVEAIEQPFQGGLFEETQNRMDAQVARVLKVPPIEMGGVIAETRFKTAPEERKTFADTGLIPLMEEFSEALQYQIIDPHFFASKITRRRPRDPKKPNTDADGKKYFTKRMGEAFEKAVSERPGTSGIYVLLDPDTLPIMGEAKLALMEHAEKMQALYRLSANQTAEWMNVELPDEGQDEPARSHVFMDSKFVDQTEPKRNEDMIPGLKPKPPAAGGDGPPKGKKSARESVVAGLAETPAEVRHSSAIPVQVRPGSPPSPEVRERVKAVAKFWRRLRVETLKRMAADEQLWSHADAREMAGFPEELKQDIWAARYRIRRIIADTPDKDARIAAVKAYFNSISKDSAIRKALGL